MFSIDTNVTAVTLHPVQEPDNGHMSSETATQARIGVSKRVAPTEPVRAWWMLVHQLPPNPPGARVRIWRRLGALGALQVKGSVYVLPATEAAREDFQWLLGEIQAAGGEGSMWRAEAIAGVDADDLVLRFQASAAEDYEAVQAEAAALHKELQRTRKPLDKATARKRLARLRTGFDDISRRDHFQAPRREVAGALLASIEQELEGGRMATTAHGAGRLQAADYRARTWVTRARVHVDRMASAWLIRRFIDPAAVFVFTDDPRGADAGAGLRFDMYGGEFTHEGDQCTFEVLRRRFGLDVPGLESIARIVHDIDLKESRYALPETTGVAASLEAITAAPIGDDQRIAFAGTLFDGLLARFSS